MIFHILFMLFGARAQQPPMYNPICYPGSTTCRALPGPTDAPPRAVSGVHGR